MEQLLYPESAVTCAGMVGFILGVLFTIVMFFIFDVSHRKKLPKVGSKEKEIEAKVKEISQAWAALVNLLLPRN